MSTAVTWNGTTYYVPAVKETRTWGASLSSYLIAISTGALQKSGGSFTLTADANFGSNYGLVAKYFKSVSSNIGASEIIRLANAEGIAWRNAANSADITLKVNASDRLQLAGVDIPTVGSTDTLTGVKTFADGSLKVAGATSGAATIKAPAVASTYAYTLPVPTAGTTETLVGQATTETLTNKTLTSPNINTQATVKAAGEVRFNNDSDTFYVGFKGGNAGENKIWTLPTADGSANQVLKTDGSAALGWASVASTVTAVDGDMIYRNSGADTNLAIGTAGKRLRSTGSVPAWGFQQASINAVSAANYTITDSDGYDAIHVTTSTSVCTITLPTAAAANTGRVITIRKVDSGSGSITISGTINGGTSNNNIASQYGWCQVVSNGSAWYWQQDIIDQGTWTPVWDATGSSFGATTYNFQNGFWKRNGREVHLDFALEMASTASVPTGDLVVNGIPFTAATSSGQYWAGSCHTNSLALSASYTWATPRIASAGTYIAMLQSGSSQAAITVVASANQGPTDRYIIGSLDYRIA